MQDKGEAVRAGIIQIGAIVLPFLLHIQRGGLQLVLDDGFIPIPGGIGQSVGACLFIFLSLHGRIADLFLNAAVGPFVSSGVLGGKIGKGIVPGVALGVPDDIVRSEPDGDNTRHLLCPVHHCQSRGGAGQAGLGRLIPEACIPGNVLPGCAAVVGALEDNRDACRTQAVFVVAVHPVLADIVGAAKAVGQIAHGQVADRSRRFFNRLSGLGIARHCRFGHTVDIRHTVGGIALQIVDGVLPEIGVAIYSLFPLNIRLALFIGSQIDGLLCNLIGLAILVLGIALQGNGDVLRAVAIDEGTVSIVVPYLLAGKLHLVRPVGVLRSHCDRMVRVLVKGLCRKADHIAAVCMEIGVCDCILVLVGDGIAVDGFLHNAVAVLLALGRINQQIGKFTQRGFNRRFIRFDPVGICGNISS